MDNAKFAFILDASVSLQMSRGMPEAEATACAQEEWGILETAKSLAVDEALDPYFRTAMLCALMSSILRQKRSSALVGTLNQIALDDLATVRVRASQGGLWSRRTGL